MEILIGIILLLFSILLSLPSRHTYHSKPAVSSVSPIEPTPVRNNSFSEWDKLFNEYCNEALAKSLGLTVSTLETYKSLESKKLALEYNICWINSDADHIPLEDRDHFTQRNISGNVVVTYYLACECQKCLVDDLLNEIIQIERQMDELIVIGQLV